METQRSVVTVWRDREELLNLRRDILGDNLERRERAVNKVYAWRVRKHELPLLLESTADIVDAGIQDERGVLGHNALRLVYATAISRFMTGLADTQTDLSRLRPSFFPPYKILQFPLALRETRHCIVHRHLPSLAELKRAARESLDWLWEWYWSHLDAAFTDSDVDDGRGKAGREVLSEREIKERLQVVLRTYVKARKNEIKSRKKDESKAAASAVATYSYLEAPIRSKQNVLLSLLLDEKAILPSSHKIGSSMSGAFLIWSPFLIALSPLTSTFLELLLDRMVGIMTAPARGLGFVVEQDPVREGMHDWVLYIVGEKGNWEDAREQKPTETTQSSKTRLLNRTLSHIFLTPAFWTLKLADSILNISDFPGKTSWEKILEAAMASGDMEMDDEGLAALPPDLEEAMDVEPTETALPVREAKKSERMEKMRGPQKKVGLWKPQRIGMIPQGWEIDE